MKYGKDIVIKHYTGIGSSILSLPEGWTKYLGDGERPPTVRWNQYVELLFASGQAVKNAYQAKHIIWDAQNTHWSGRRIEPNDIVGFRVISRDTAHGTLRLKRATGIERGTFTLAPMGRNFNVTELDYASGTTDHNNAPHPEAKGMTLPEGLKSLEVTVDNGRLGIMVNGECVFYTSSLTDGCVTLERK